MTTLVKAKLVAQGGGSDIEFMYNPTELSFSRSMQLNCSGGARTDDGIPKISFGAPEPYSLTVGKITCDTFETGKSVLTEYIDKFRESVDFLSDTERPPIYIFTWGKQQYMRCFVQSLSYDLTLFLPDGTPVRATVSLTLKEIGETTSSGGSTSSSGSSRTSDSRW